MNTVNRRHPESGVARQPKAGFTLVEMLVATGLVVLIMSFFAQIYGTAISTMTEQKGIGNNDQRARVLNDLLRNDLKYMSYKQVDAAHGSTPGIVPITPGDGPILDLENQKGYFYLSENDPYDPTDDVLQFTIAIDADSYDDFRVGKAEELGTFRNQPVYDGGPQSAPGQSRFAEVAYFLRKGVLYRHVLLLRDTDGVDEQPGNGPLDRRFGFSGVDIQGGVNRQDYDEGSRVFYRDFDYSATRRFVGVESGGVTTDVYSSLWFHGAKSLLNGGAEKSRLSLGLPWYRFGHHIDLGFKADGRLHNGMPREYTIPNADGEFIGRFTHWETSSDYMAFPGTYSPSDSIVRRDVELEYGPNGWLQTPDGATILSSGARVGEDVVLTNVESFDVEVWDPTFGGFLPLGHRNSAGREFAASQNVHNTSYGPRISGNVIFDTWHTGATIGTGLPPYRPVRYDLDASLDENLPIHASRRNHPYDDTDVTNGTVVAIPSLRQTIDDNYWGESSQPPPVVRRSNSWVYQLIQPGLTDPSVTPDFPALLGNVVQDGTTIWKCIDNRIGLSAVRITIRYVDPQTQLSRQLTIIHSFAK